MTDTTEIRKQKDADYGDPAIALKGIGKAWQTYLETACGATFKENICHADVALMRAIEKVFRIAYRGISDDGVRDNVKDIQVYADITAELLGVKEKETRG